MLARFSRLVTAAGRSAASRRRYVQSAAPLASPHAKPTETTSAADGEAGRPSFIDRVKTQGAALLLGPFLSTGVRFDRNLEGMNVVHVGADKVVVELVVHQGLANAYGTLHGGATCTIVDVVSTMALLAIDPLRAGVSVDLNCSFLSAAKVGEKIVIEARVLRSGKKLGFTEVDIWKGEGAAKVMVATGRHTKAL